MNRYALIIANDTYDDPRFRPLCAPIADVNELSKVLGDPNIGNFTIQPHINEQETEITRALERFFRKREKEDLLLVHFSGHGMKDINGKLFLAVKDTDPDEPNSSAIPARFLREQMDQCRSQKILLILDCCYAGAFEEGTRATGTTVGVQEAFQGSGYGRWIFAASDETQYAFEGQVENEVVRPSVFTRAIVEGLRTGKADKLGDHDGYVSIRDLKKYVEESIKTSGFRQTPYLWTYKERGELLVALDPSPELPADLVSKAKSRLPTFRCQAARGLGELIRLSTASEKLIELAYKMLAGLTQNEEGNVANTAMRELADLMESPTWRLAVLSEEIHGRLQIFRENPPPVADDDEIIGLRALLDVTHKINTGTSRDSVLQALLEATMDLTKAERGAVFLPDSRGDLILAAGRTGSTESLSNRIGIPLESLGTAAKSGRTAVLLEGIYDYMPDDPKDDYDGAAHNAVVFPVKAGTKGALYLDAPARDETFKISRVLSPEIVRNIAMCAETAIDNILSEGHREIARYEQHIQIAVDVQHSLICPPRSLSYAKFDYRFYGAVGVSGDLVQFIETPGGVYVVVLDISGKGLSAALIGSTLYGLLYSEFMHESSLAETAAAANRFLCAKVEVGRYATAVLLHLDQIGKIELVNCGSVAPLLISSDSIPVTSLEEGSFPIGLAPEAEFTSSTLKLKPNDRLLLYSDGVTEAMNPDGELFGIDRLKDVCREGLTAIDEAVIKFCDKRLADDLSLVELTYLGRPAALGR